MKDYWGPIFAILWKDLLLEFRSREVMVPLLIFALLVVVIFNFSLAPRPSVVPMVAPGILWVSFTFAGVLGLNRIFAAEKESGGLQGLMLVPASRDVLYLGKLIGSFIFLMVMELVTLPVFLLFLNLPIWVPQIWPIATLATLGFSAVGTTVATMAANTKAREVMLPLLFFPILVPVIIAAVLATGSVLRGEPWSEYSRWLGLMAAFDVVFLVVSAMTYGFLLEE